MLPSSRIIPTKNVSSQPVAGLAFDNDVGIVELEAKWSRSSHWRQEVKDWFFDAARAGKVAREESGLILDPKWLRMCGGVWVWVPGPETLRFPCSFPHSAESLSLGGGEPPGLDSIWTVLIGPLICDSRAEFFLCLGGRPERTGPDWDLFPMGFPNVLLLGDIVLFHVTE